MPTENEILTRWLLTAIQKGNFDTYLLETKAKVRLVPVAGQSGADYSTPPDLTNRVESIFADTEGNVCAEVVLSGTLVKLFAGMLSPNRYYTLPHAFIFKVGGEETRIQRIVAYWILPKI